MAAASALPPSTAVVTGAGGGLGRALVLELVARGARVGIADVDAARADAVLAEVHAAGGTGFAAACDVRDGDQVVALAERSVAELGAVDLLVNNAGVGVGGAIGEIPLDDWRWCVEVNLLGVAYGCHAFVPAMRRRGRGHVINVASAAGFAAAPEMGPYNASKAGAIAISETLAAELLGTGVGVSVVCPTFFKTGIVDAMRTSGDRARRTAEKLMAAATLEAEAVARITLDAAARGERYVFPQPDARLLWRLKRLAPERALGLAALIADPRGALRRRSRARTAGPSQDALAPR